MKKIRLAIFASGNGSNADAIMHYFQNHVHVEVALVLCNNATAFVLKRAEKYKIPSHVFTKNQFQEGDVNAFLKKSNITHLVLAGFLWLVPEKIIVAFPGSIINIHPSLLPKFGGKGMYGMYVHEAVVAAGEKETGITIHVVNKHYDEGRILAQIKCEILPDDDAKTVAAKVLKLEHENYPKVIEKWAISSMDQSTKTLPL